MSPVRLVWHWMAQPQDWGVKPLLGVKLRSLREEFSSDLVKNKVAPNSVIANLDFVKDVRRIQQKKNQGETLTRDEQARAELYGRAQLFQEIAAGSMPGMIPHPDDPRTAWLPPGALSIPEGNAILTSIFPKEPINVLTNDFQYFLGRIRESGFQMAGPAAEQFVKSLDRALASRDIFPDRRPVQWELFYWKWRPFHFAWMLYLVSAFLWMVRRKKSSAKKNVNAHPALWLFAAGFAMHTLGFVLRVMIAGRPPVSNMYESIIWVSWGAVLFSWVLWFFYHSPLVSNTAAFVGAFGLIIGENLPAVLDSSISPLVPVLRSNYWLTVHVLTITLGYAAFALNWGIAHALLYRLAVTPRKTKSIEQLTEFLYRSLQIGIIFLSVGTVLGGVWASYSWGRFWGWDPKETWALIAVVTYLVVFHGRVAGWLDSFGVAFWCAVSFLTVIMAWYGVNFVLGAGLHSYGFGGGGLPYVLAVAGADLISLLFFLQRFRMRA